MASSGNFCNFSIPLRPRSPYSSSDQITGGGLSIKLPSSGGIEPVIASMSPNSGKWYWEYRAGQGGTNTSGRPSIAVSEQGVKKDSEYYGGKSGITGVLFVTNDGGKRINGSDTSYGNTVSQHDIVQIALDCDNGAVYFGINNTWQNSGNPESGASKTGAALSSGIQNVAIDILHVRYVGGTIDQYNFGQDDTFGGAITAAGNADGNGHGVFKYAPPTGFLALCSANLPISDNIDPAGDDGADENPTKQFNVVTYTGDGSTSNAISNLGFSPDLVWIGQRSSPTSNYSNGMFDTSRGRAKVLYSHRSDKQPSDSSSTQDLVSFDSDGFTVGTNNSASVNGSSKEMVAWCWKCAGGTTSSNSSGSANSTVQVNTKAGFSICLTDNYTAANGVTIGHGLGVKPAFYLHKTTGDNSSGGASQAFNWHVYHHSLGATKALFIHLTNAAATAIGYWNNTEPTTDVLSLGNLIAGNGQSLVYAWAEVEGYSKFGTYEGNGNADGPFVYTGFRPRLLFIKNSEQSSNWGVYDSARQTFNPNENYLRWNTGEAEGGTSTTFDVDFLSNGFKVRSTETDLNTSDKTFIYGAWADVPFKYNNTF